MTKNIGLFLLTFFVASVVAETRADVWKSTAESTLSFVAKVDGAELPGEFSDFEVELTTQSRGASPIGFKVTIDLAATDLGDADMNATLFSPDWFDTGKHSHAVFESSQVVETTSEKFVATGELNLKGSKKELSFPIGFKRSEDSASIIGSTLINRNDFNVGAGTWSSEETVGIMVELTFDVKLDRAR